MPPSSANEPTGNFRFICRASHNAYDDPIVYPGQPGASHLHTFFGNTLTNASSTYSSLRTTGDSTCSGGPINRSAYWAPAMINGAGKVVMPDYMAVYYKGTFGGVAGIGAIPTLPRGLRMIAGFDMATHTARDIYWYCDGVHSTTLATIPTNCDLSERIGGVIHFPQCWDGVNLDSPNHRSHLASIYWDPNDGKPKCPSTHPVHIPEFTLLIWYPHTGDAATWRLSSDTMPGMTMAPGSTLHADWFGAWDDGVMATWTQRCIRGLLSCSSGQLGDGTMLKQPPYTLPDRRPPVDPPAR